MKVLELIGWKLGLTLLGIVAASAWALSSCGDDPPPGPSSEHGSQPAPDPPRTVLNGAGATFPYPVYSQWAHTYHKVTGVKLNYQSIGSGGGIAQIKSRTVDFGTTDAPLPAAELEELGLLQFPLVVGGVVPVINVDGVAAGQLKLDGPTLAAIYLGQLRKWNDKAIADLNPGVPLPDREIAVVHRADGSGTTWIFTNYLAKVSSEWRDKVGTDKAIEWPTGMGGKGNEGVAAYVQRIPGSIGYVEFAYALQNEMAYVQLRNGAGRFIAPTIAAFQAAAANADWSADPAFYLVLTDQPGDHSWPITGASFILVYKEQRDATKARALLEFFDWCYRRGAPAAEKLHYVPIPTAVAQLVRGLWKTAIRSGGNPVWD
jgi:phosphate transport system substrate-binding protein